MQTTVQYLDALAASMRRQGGTGSDYAIAHALGIRPSAVSRYRNGHGTFDDALIPSIARLLGVPVEQVMVDVQAERARSPEVRAVWQRVARRLAELAGVVAVAILATAGGSGTAQAGGVDAVAGAGRAIHYAHMLRRLIRWLGALADDAADAIA